MTLVDDIQALIDSDENLTEAVLIGKLPREIASIAASIPLISGETWDRSMSGTGLSFPSEYNYLAIVLQQWRFPDAPPDLQGFGKYFQGGPAPAAFLHFQLAYQLTLRADEMGYEVIIDDSLSRAMEEAKLFLKQR